MNVLNIKKVRIFQQNVAQYILSDFSHWIEKLHEWRFYD